MRDGDKMKGLIDRLVSMVEKEPEEESQRDQVKKIIELFIYEFDEREQVEIVKAIFQQLSYRNIIEKPKYMLAVSNMKIRTYFFNWIFASIFLLISGILFSDNPFITRLNETLVTIASVLGF